MSSPDDLMPPSGSSWPGPDDVTVASGGPSRTAPSRIGRYTVLRVIASGGMGTVLEALQDDPRRSVAIKIMKAGLDSPEALRRFQFEAQLLARLRHPGIAQVYEAGTHDDGSGPVPFYAMEYIPNGRPITEYAVDRKLDLRARLELFARVCDAVHHGHQRGIIHRDLKPGNIVVDSEGNPKVIDFGVARAADSDSALSVFQTQAGQLIGSIAYMSPEQIDGDPRDLDARSDVYALGVVLYELIAGRLPYDLSTARIYDAARVVREQDPARLRAVVPDLPAEVETVVRKALEKDRERRYQSAHALADDLRRFLSGQTVTASPPSAAYQMRVFARRHKAMLAGVAAVFAVLVVAVVAVSSMYVRAERLRKVAEHESARSQAAVDFLTESLASLEPVGYEHEPTMSDLLQRLESNIEGAFPDDPLVEAKLRKTIGWAYMSRFDWAGIERHLIRSLDLRVKGGAGKDPEALEILQMLATVYDVTGETGREIDMRREAAAVCLALHGERDSLTVASRFDLVSALCNGSRFQEAMDEATATASLAAQVLGPEHETTLACRAQVGWLQLAQGELAAAEATNGALLDTSRRRMGESAKLTRRVRSQLAGTLIAEGKLDDAEKLYGEAAVPADLGIERRYQGDPKIAGEAQMLVFWETWCPFSQRTVPSLEKPHLRYPELDVVGITRARPPSTDEKVLKFIEEKGISFPIVRSTRMPWAYFDVPGTPFVVLARKRRVLWENSMQAPDVVLDRLLRGVMERDRG